MKQIRIAGGVGLSPSEWENMSPAAFRAWVRGFDDMQKTMAENRRRENYNLAVMVRAAVGANRMPNYERFFPDGKAAKQKEPMTDMQMYQQVLALNAALGGTVAGG